MCGLAGVARIDGGDLPATTSHLLEAMAHSLTHRGPDGSKLLLEGPVGLAFTRLSIVDPVGGDQPLENAERSAVLIANGEVYNHRELEARLPRGVLRTQSDCEVLVHLYPYEHHRFLDDVRGIFAVVVWDRAAGKLLLARDRFGIKPLYFSRNGNQITFASELKALFVDPRVPRAVDWRACLTEQMMMGAARLEGGPPTAWFENVEAVPPGCIVEFDLRDGTRRDHRYWRLPGTVHEQSASDDEFIGMYRELLADSVRESGMSDAEIGLFLSGGIDSAAVAAFSDLPTLHTFTALNGGTLSNGDGEHAHRVAAALGLPNHQVIFDPSRVPDADEWKRLLWLLETPLCGPEQFYKYELHRFARATRPDLKVMLLGQASDEFNGGYTVELAAGGDWYDFLATLRELGRSQALLDAPRLAPWWAHTLPLLRDEAIAAVGASIEDPYDAYLAWRYRQIQQYNCWHEDRTAAGCGIEARVPFLDHRIVELTAQITPAQRPSLLWDKRILREALRGLLPEELLQRPKFSFFYGSGVRHVYRTFVRMLAADGGALLEEALAGPRIGELIDGDAARMTLQHLERQPENTQLEALLHVVNLGLLEQFVADLPVPPIDWPVMALPAELTIDAWDTSSISREVIPEPALDPDLVPQFAEGVLLVHAEQTGSWFLVLDGSLEYVLDEREDEDWLRLLRAIDGRRSLAEILNEIGCPLERVRELLAEATDVGVVALVPQAAPVSAG